MTPEILDTFAEIEAAHRALMTRLVALEAEARRCSSLEDLADLAYMLREADKLFDHSGVQTRKLSALIAKLFYVLWSVDPDGPDKVKTEYCTCAPDPQHHVHIPNADSDPEGYRRMLTALGVPDEVIQRRLFKVSYGQLAAYVTEMKRAGLPLPFESNEGRTYVEHRLEIKKRRGLSRPGTSANCVNQETRDEQRDDIPF